ncbi:putative bifunctional diguanylate cyclase/phosphodiesterase [Propionivibrio limicola]|uniref:putative bifunctional diguanylate cyclase/phosphodiesterase n=1 Tax=Propionivibrio limicola TaxID=167645 RepID=UPI0012909C16|nr:EAL domain-containing protein [Propionivibrio limicola]
MVKPSDGDDWGSRKDSIIGLGERSFHKSYYPQLRQNMDRLERFRTLLDRTTDFVILVDLGAGTIVDANVALGRVVCKPVETVIGRPFAELGLGDTAHVLQELRREVGEARGSAQAGSAESPGHTLIIDHQCCDSRLSIELTYRVTVLEGRPYGVMVGRDVTERQRSLEMVEALLAEKDALLDNALVGIVMLRQRKIVSCNRRYEEIYGYPHGSLIGQTTRALYDSDATFAALGEEAYGGIGGGGNFSATLRMMRADGSTFWCELAGRAIDPERPDEGSIWIVSDISERKRAEEKARFLSYHDSLTGLPNQVLLQDRLQQSIAFSTKAGTKVALIVLDLDRFKKLNDFLGRTAADRLLIEIAARISESLRGTDTLSRQSGDEFVLLLANLAEPDAIVTFLGELMERLHEPFDIEGKEVTTSLSAGIVIYPEDGADFATLLKKADMAMYRAKEAGRNTYRFFNDGMNDDAVEQVMLHAGLRRGLENHQFVLHYQPQINIASGELIGAEALIRWKHPDLGVVSPGRFIPVAEETGLIIEIGDWVLREACREAVRWQTLGAAAPTVAVNLSALQFKRGNIEYSVARALEESGLDPAMLELELTESILIRDTENVLATVKRLKLMGVKLSIDDFGTGYSSLAYLKRFEVDKLKIDQAFIRGLATEQEDAAIVRAIIQMARSLGLRTIAEGVETKPVLDLLHLYHCDEVQGYYYSPPLPAREFAAYLASSSPSNGNGRR